MTQQEAWHRISNDLIFIRPVDIPMEPGNAKAISQTIQQHFIDVFDEKYAAMENGVWNLLKVDSQPPRPRLSELDRSRHSKKTQVELLLITMFLKDRANGHGAESALYDGVGFTPKLCQASEQKHGGANCFGTWAG